MAQHKLEISELDFENIKGSLKRFLANQNEFKDYDFEGSSMAILLDLLAYNTHYLAYNANFVANEMFMDTAQLRSSVASLAKLVGYTPNSARAPIADLKLVINDGTGASITIPAGTKFTSSIDGLTYTFVSVGVEAVYARTPQIRNLSLSLPLLGNLARVIFSPNCTRSVSPLSLSLSLSLEIRRVRFYKNCTRAIWPLSPSFEKFGACIF